MIHVHTFPAIEPDNHHPGWEIVLWWHAFEFDGRFRKDIDIISKATNAIVHLPPFEEDEDFIEGELIFEGQIVRIYFEYSLGYMSLMSDSRDVLEALLRTIKPHIVVDL